MRRLAPVVLLILVALLVGLGIVFVGGDDGTGPEPPAGRDVDAPAATTGGADDRDERRARVTRREGAEPTEAGQADPDEQKPPGGLRVDVVDESGTACAGVPVQLYGIAPDQTWVRERRLTDEQGRTTFSERPFTKGSVTVALPLTERPAVELDRTRFGGPSVRLEIPATGRVVCEVFDLTGASITKPVSIVLRRADEDDGSPPAWEREDAADAWETARDGVATYPHVEPGLGLVAIVPSPERAHVTVRVPFRGPDSAGDEVRIRLVVGEPRPVVTGRLVDPEGQPLGGIRVFGDILEPGDEWVHWHHQDEVVTDGEGRFRLALDVPRASAASGTLRLGRRLPSGDGQEMWRSAELAVIELPAGLSAAGHDVGDVVSAHGQVVAAGVVVDAAGKPVAGAEVTALDPRYRLDDTPPVRTAEDGSFRILGALPESEVGIAVEADGHFLDAVPRVPAGSSGVRVQLSTGARLRGSFVPVPGFRVDTLRVFLRGKPAQTGGPGSMRPQGRSIDVRDGEFATARVRPGIGDVVVQASWSEATQLLVIDNVRFVAGEECDDPRLRDIDLSEVVRPITVRVRDADGSPIAAAEVNHRPADLGKGAPWVDVATDEQGRASILSLAAQAEVLVIAEGHRAVTRTVAAGELDVTLERVSATVVTIAIRDDSPFPAPPHRLTADLLWVGPPGSSGGRDHDASYGDPRDVDGWDDGFDERREATISVNEPGRYEIELIIWRSDVDGASGSSIESAPERCIVEVPGNGKPVRVETGIHAEQFAQRMRDAE
jgi:hypothetical protein